jgi:hypothetical protein
MGIAQLSVASAQEDAWYAIYTEHQHEKSAVALLVRTGFEFLLPMYLSRVSSVPLPVHARIATPLDIEVATVPVKISPRFGGLH